MKRILIVIAKILGGLALVLVLFSAFLLIDAWTAMGATATGDRKVKVEASTNFSEGVFQNSIPQEDMETGAIIQRWFAPNSAIREPVAPLPLQARTRTDYKETSVDSLRVTWLGHSTTLIEIDGKRILTDPVWGERASPFTFFGPSRFHAPPLPEDSMPTLDLVLISHDHYDHLDEPTIRFLAEKSVRFVVPLGIGAHLEYWGVSADRITELDWWDEIDVDGLKIVCTPSRHFSGRALAQNTTLWSSWTVIGKTQRVFFSGDSAMTPQFKEIGDKYGPFDLTMLESGAYSQLWADVHLGPEQAVQAHIDLQGKLMMPIHWGTFDLALHGWTEPAERVRASAQKLNVNLVTPEPGEIVDVANPRPVKAWWPSNPWQTAEEAPVVSSGL